MKLKVNNLENKESTKEVSFPDALFNTKVSPDLIHEIILSTQKNRQKAWAHTKDRSEVSGGGKKPWKQKGTGRARHGSSRSPLWRGGGITFGPRNERVFKNKINKKANRLALVSMLADLIKTKNAILIEDFDIGNPKTKEFLSVISKFTNTDKKETILIILKEASRNIKLAAKNLQKINIINIDNINLEALMKPKKVLISENALKSFLELYKDLIKE
jgi:large subunit ribosomal protein L4